MTGLILTGVIMLAVVTAAICVLARVYARHTVWADSEKPLWKNCEECQRCGVTMIDGSPVPAEYRTFYRTVSGTAKRHGVFQGPIANVVSCEDCLGLGSVWVYQDKARRGLPGMPLFPGDAR